MATNRELPTVKRKVPRCPDWLSRGVVTPDAAMWDGAQDGFRRTGILIGVTSLAAVGVLAVIAFAAPTAPVWVSVAVVAGGVASVCTWAGMANAGMSGVAAVGRHSSKDPRYSDTSLHADLAWSAVGVGTSAAALGISGAAEAPDLAVKLHNSLYTGVKVGWAVCGDINDN